MRLLWIRSCTCMYYLDKSVNLPNPATPDFRNPLESLYLQVRNLAFSAALQFTHNDTDARSGQ